MVLELAKKFGRDTNNVAEYYALLAALDYATTHGIQALRIRSDSELLVRQMQGRYKVKSADLKPLYERASILSRQLKYFVIEHVRREHNTRRGCARECRARFRAGQFLVARSEARGAASRCASESSVAPPQNPRALRERSAGSHRAARNTRRHRASPRRSHASKRHVVQVFGPEALRQTR